jgi:hypothetical protein
MRKHFVWLATLVFSLSAVAAERSFHFTDATLQHAPAGFRSLLAGEGKPGDWQVIEDEMPSAMRKITGDAPVTSRRKVLAQLSNDPTDERFPLLVFDGDSYGDFTLTTRFKLVGGSAEQMAGVVFRLQDERNFYVIRASGLGKNIRFYKMVSGIRSSPIGPDVAITQGVWHELKIECKGNQIRGWLDGKDALPPLTDNSFTAGKIGFWTKSDSVAYFGDTDLVYTPREPFAQKMVRDLMKLQPRLRGVRIFTPVAGSDELKVIASDQPGLLGQTGTDTEARCFRTGAIFQAKDKVGTVTVMMPLRDRNGEIVAVTHLVMESFPGQTEQNVLSRATPLMKYMQSGIQSARDLTD